MSIGYGSHMVDWSSELQPGPVDGLINAGGLACWHYTLRLSVYTNKLD